MTKAQADPWTRRENRHGNYARGEILADVNRSEVATLMGHLHRDNADGTQRR